MKVQILAFQKYTYRPVSVTRSGRWNWEETPVRLLYCIVLRLGLAIIVFDKTMAWSASIS